MLKRRVALAKQSGLVDPKLGHGRGKIILFARARHFRDAAAIGVNFFYREAVILKRHFAAGSALVFQLLDRHRKPRVDGLGRLGFDTRDCQLIGFDGVQRFIAFIDQTLHLPRDIGVLLDERVEHSLESDEGKRCQRRHESQRQPTAPVARAEIKPRSQIDFRWLQNRNHHKWQCADNSPGIGTEIAVNLRNIDKYGQALRKRDEQADNGGDDFDNPRRDIDDPPQFGGVRHACADRFNLNFRRHRNSTLFTRRP